VPDNGYVIDPVKGPRVVPTHERALAPVQPPAPDVDGFVGAFLRELNFGQGVSLARASVSRSGHSWPAESSTNSI
jgi:starch phosphorylase